MSNKNLKRPAGTKDYLPGMASKKRKLENRLNGAFKAWGYQEIITPTFEFYDLLANGTEVLQTKMYKFFNRQGEIMALRPEMTAPIARLAATEMRSEKLPLRLSYSANVFRHESPRAGRYREFYQTGVELLGVDSPMGDTEVIAIAAEAIADKVGLNNFNIDIGDVDYFTGIMERAELEESEQELIRKALSDKNLVELKKLLVNSGLSKQQQEAILQSNQLRGGIEVIAEAKKLVSNKKSLAALDNLAEVYNNLEFFELTDHITIDLSMVRKFNYYTGTVFEGYTKDLGYTICGGGRYDKLVKKFGYPIPAIGFAVGIDRLLLSLEKQGYKFVADNDKSLILFKPEQKQSAFKLANYLRNNKQIVEIEAAKRDLAEVKAYAASKGIKQILALGTFEFEAGSEIELAEIKVTKINVGDNNE